MRPRPDLRIRSPLLALSLALAGPPGPLAPDDRPVGGFRSRYNHQPPLPRVPDEERLAAARAKRERKAARKNTA